MRVSAAPALRRDIQALRGYAVLIVLLYHAGVSLLPHGYLGVDVFFVVSGFLITQLIRRDIEANQFSLIGFYIRRIKRLLPSAYLTIILSIAVAEIFLTNLEWRDFRVQVLGALTYTTNIVLWRQSGYFETAAELKPLLHMWSLAIEEQYYVILPLMLIGLPRWIWLPFLVSLFFASVTWCVLNQTDPGSNFYLLPSRAWELLLGSIGALLPGTIVRRLTGNWLAWVALGVLLVAPSLAYTRVHPGPLTVLVCGATLILLLAPEDRLRMSAVAYPLVAAGNISYVLYLIHWPLLAFFHNAWIGDDQVVAAAWRFGLVALSVLLAIAMHRWVEQPVRYAAGMQPKYVFTLTLAGALTLALLVEMRDPSPGGARDYAHVRRPNHGFDSKCDFKSNFEPIEDCRNSDNPEILVWGDSYAMHLIPGLLGEHTKTRGLIQATRSVCGPLLDVAPVIQAWGYDIEWARHCIAFNDSVLEWLQQAESVRLVVLSSPLVQYLPKGENELLWRNHPDDAALDHDLTIRKAAAALKRTVDAVRASGKKVVMVAPPPTSGVDFSRCQERLASEKLVLGANAQCGMDRAAYVAERGQVLELLRALPELADLEVIDFDSVLCESNNCHTFVDGVFVYRDPYHFSYEGAVWIARQVRLLEQIEQRAR